MSERSGPRQPLPDQLRSVALLGIVVVNAPFMAVGIDGFASQTDPAALDEAVAFAITALAEAKFYILFSFLFGYSANFIVRDGSANQLRRWRRRMAGLALVGLAHAVFLFVGDILLAYAILGTGLMFLFARRDRTVLVSGFAAALLGLLWLGLLVLIAASSPDDLSSDPTLDQLDTALATGTFLQAAEARLEALPVLLLVLGSLQWPLAFASFCVGLVAGRHGFLSDPETRRNTWRRMAIWGIAIGLPVQIVATVLATGGSDATTDFRGMAGIALLVATAPLLTAGYVGLLALLSIARLRVLAAIQDPGRASLTIYIGQSLVLSIIFCGWGFGLFGQLGAAAVTGVAVLTWAMLALAMRLWLRRFRQGPLEAAMARWTGRLAASAGEPKASRRP